jgi:hypothetical protein
MAAEREVFMFYHEIAAEGLKVIKMQVKFKKCQVC